MISRRLALVCVLFLLAFSYGLADSTDHWQAGSDKQLGVTFLYPPGWKTSPGYSDRTYFAGDDGSVQMMAAGAATPEQMCQSQADHHLRPYGSHPTIRSMKVQGHAACLIWPSDDQGANADAEVEVQLPEPVVIDGDSYNLLMLLADKNHILEIVRTLKFIPPSELAEEETLKSVARNLGMDQGGPCVDAALQAL